MWKKTEVRQPRRPLPLSELGHEALHIVPGLRTEPHSHTDLRRQQPQGSRAVARKQRLPLSRLKWALHYVRLHLCPGTHQSCGEDLPTSVCAYLGSTVATESLVLIEY